MGNFATGKYSTAICRRCGWAYPYNSLKAETTKLRVCDTCYDGEYDIVNHPQNRAAPVTPDPEGLKDASPDVHLATTSVGWTVSLTMGKYKGLRGGYFGDDP